MELNIFADVEFEREVENHDEAEAFCWLPL